MEFILHGFSLQTNVTGLANIQNRGSMQGHVESGVWPGSRHDWTCIVGRTYFWRNTSNATISFLFRGVSHDVDGMCFEIKDSKKKENFFRIFSDYISFHIWTLVWIYILLQMTMHSFENTEYIEIGILEMVSLFPTRWYARNVTALRISLTLSILR